MVTWVLLVVLGCTPRSAPGLSAAEVLPLVRPDAETPEAWAAAVVEGLRAADRIPTADEACQVLAVIEQESGYDPSPPVPGLGQLARQELESRVEDTLGLLGGPTLRQLLDVRPDPEGASFREALSEVRTEEELDRWYRAVVAHHEGRVPLVGSAVRLAAPRLEERLNPVATVGSMQVSAAYAQDHPVSRGLSREAVRDTLYTLDGGVRYGTLRLFDTAAYADPAHRFADYNAGPFASRNASFQAMVSELSGTSLARDGDLLSYGGRGRARRRQQGETVAALRGLAEELGLAEAQLLRDLHREKEVSFETTATYRAVQQRWAEGHGEAAPYSEVPQVTLDSPKLSGTWTTAVFAQRTERRYRACLARAQ